MGAALSAIFEFLPLRSGLFISASQKNAKKVTF